VTDPGNAAVRLRTPFFRVRWKIYLFMWGLALLAYFQQRGLAVASVKIMPELGLTQVELGWLETAFLIAYAGMQIPGGVIGQRLGARAMFVLIGTVAFVSTMTMPLAPRVLTGTALFVVLLIAQFLFGASQGPIFPVSSGVFEAWIRRRHWALAQGLQSGGANLGAAVVPPLVAWLMSEFDWQRALAWTSLPAFLLALWWGWYGRNTPAEHPAVSVAELAELEGSVVAADQRITLQRLWTVLKNRDVLLLTFAYACMNYTFYLLVNWCFLYLVQERHFALLEGGFLASAPPVGAAVGATAGGLLAAPLVRHFGLRAGLRLVPLVALPASALLLFLAVDAADPYFAVAALTLCFAAIEMTEGPFWAAVMEVARADTMAATGVLNTGGNIGGIIATPIIAYLSAQHLWTAAFLIGSLFALTGAATWLLVDPTRRMAPSSGVLQPVPA
jgi:ACS family glucarate transporter-like MFS transporter